MAAYKINTSNELRNKERAWLMSRNYMSVLWENELILGTTLGGLTGLLFPSLGLLTGVHLGGMTILSFYLINDGFLENHGLNIQTHNLVTASE